MSTKGRRKAQDKHHHIDQRADAIITAAGAPPAPLSVKNTPTTDDDQLLTTQQVSVMLGVSEQWLEVGRQQGYGPEYQKLGPRLLRYRRGGVLDWVRQRAALFARKGKREAEHAS